MTQPQSDSAQADLSVLLDAAGIAVTDEGKARARALLAEARAKRTPEQAAKLRRQLGLPTSAP